MREVKVTFQPSGQSVYVLPGTSLLEAAGRAGIILQTPCGGRGTCGKCRVRIPDSEPGEADRAALTDELIKDGYRLACQTAIQRPAAVEVPAESMFETSQRILVTDAETRGELKPGIRKTHFRLPPPTSKDARADQRRLLDAIGDVELPWPLARGLPRFLRRHGWEGTAVCAGSRLIALEPGDTSRAALGVAFDIGTTTVVATLFDLLTGRQLAVVSKMNAQVAYGDDVVSRIRRVREDGLALTQLQEILLETVNDIIAQLCGRADRSSNHIYEVVIAGNATMQQILCGYDPSALGEVPFVQTFDRAQTVKAERLGLKSNEGAEVYVLPQLGGFVGGDTVGGMVAARVDRWGKPVLMVDIGTNGEIVLAHDGKLLAASAAAGPAFEGARITHGMRATAGAIEKVIVGQDILLNVIGNVKPAGLCGTALIDATAGLLRAGVLENTGRILSGDELPSALSAKVAQRVVVDGEHADVVLANAETTATGERICLFQKDVRELQLATGAIRAAINILLRQAGLEADDLGVVLLAGAFGNFIRRNNARRIGLLPQVPCSRIRFIGNAASLGAKLTLLSSDERAYAEDLRVRTQHVDLSLDPEFQMEFGMAMLFPEDEVDDCD